jgi:hypothetical protein
MHGGPKDGRTYDYPEPLPNVLTFQRFDLTCTAHADDYRRRPYTHQYHYLQPDMLEGPVQL